jgi:hypothetical protein
MRSPSPAAFPAAPAADDRREPSLARAAAGPRALRPAPQPAAGTALPELRAGERLAVLSGAAPTSSEAKSMLAKAALALGGVLALVGAATLVRLATGL